jgi:hypothetical protein
MFVVEAATLPQGPYALVDALIALNEQEALHQAETLHKSPENNNVVRVRQMNEEGSVNVIKWLLEQLRKKAPK